MRFPTYHQGKPAMQSSPTPLATGSKGTVGSMKVLWYWGLVLVRSYVVILVVHLWPLCLILRIQFQHFFLEKVSWNYQDWIRIWKLNEIDLFLFPDEILQSDTVHSQTQSHRWYLNPKEWSFPCYLSFSCLNTHIWIPLKDSLQSLRISSRQVHFQKRTCISLFNSTLFRNDPT